MKLLTAIMLLCMALSPWLSGLSRAEVLYDQDGIVLKGEARVVAFGAATCQVLQEQVPEASYEKMKHNHGEALDIWQMSYSVHNGTGRELPYLRAQFYIESEWPPCTTWEDGSSSHAIHYKWAGATPLVDMPYGMRVDQTVHEKVYLLVFRGQEPFFREWDVHFRFDGDAPVSESRKAPGRPAPAARKMSSPPKDGIELSNSPGCYFRRFDPNWKNQEKLQWSWTGECVDEWAQGEGTLRVVRQDDEDDGEWDFEWSGHLQKGRREGHWVTRSSDGKTQDEGSFVNGRKHGPWIEKFGDSEDKGSYVDGTREGIWVDTFGVNSPPQKQLVSEIPYLNGEIHGKVVTRFGSRVVMETLYEHGEKVR